MPWEPLEAIAMVPAPALTGIAKLVFPDVEIPDRGGVYVAQAFGGPFEGWIAILEQADGGPRLIAGPQEARR